MQFKVLGDSNNVPYCSSDIIINNLNSAAKNIDSYSDSNKRVVYDCLGKHHGQSPDAMICVFEFPFPQLIIDNLAGKPTFGVSRDNLWFLLQGGYPTNLSDYFCLGVDSKVWRYCYNPKPKDKFTFLAMGESNSRSNFEFIISLYCQTFSGDNSVRLLLRDRNATDLFKTYVKQMADNYKVEILHDDRQLNNHEEEIQIIQKADCAIFINKSSTWNLPNLQIFSCGIPTLCTSYSGTREYSIDGVSSLEIKYTLEELTDDYLMDAQSIGLKNHLFPRAFYPHPPLFVMPDPKDFKEKLIRIREDKNLRDNLSIGGRLIAEKFTWERAASNLSFLLDKYCQ